MIDGGVNISYYKSFKITPCSIYDPDGEVHWATYHPYDTPFSKIIAEAKLTIDEFLNEDVASG